MDSRNELQRKKREERKKRRFRNQMISYMVTAILILAMAAGIVFGADRLLGGKEENGQNRQDASQEPSRESLPDGQQEKQDIIDDLLADEEEIAVTPEPTPEVTEPTPEERLDEIINANIEAMPLEDKVAGLFVVTPESITGVSAVIQAGEGTRDALARYAVGGLIYFAQNIGRAAERNAGEYEAICEVSCFPGCGRGGWNRGKSGIGRHRTQSGACGRYRCNGRHRECL